MLGAASGGLLGIIGWILGTTFGPSLSSDPEVQYVALIVVWQTGIALVLGLIVCYERTLVADPNVVFPAFLLDIHSRKGPTVITALFFCGVFGLLGWHVYRIGRAVLWRQARQEAIKESYAEGPSIENLPHLRRLAEGQVLVLEEIAGFSVGEPLVRAIPPKPSYGEFAPHPPAIIYSVLYRPKDAPVSSYQPTVMAEVTQFPNPEWARYKAKYPSAFNPAVDDPRSLVTIAKFGNRVVMDDSIRYPDGGGEIDFLWPSGDIVVNLRYQTRDVNEDFLKRYLERYPSSIGPGISR